MSIESISEEIREVNLSYLMLAQQMIREDRDTAVFRLGISGDVAGILERLTPGQLLKMASASTLLCRFRFDDNLIFGLLSGYAKEGSAARTHAAIVAAGQPVEALA